MKYRDFRKHSIEAFQHDLEVNLSKVDQRLLSNDDFHSLLMKLVDHHAPIKTKYLRGNDQPFMNKELRKEHMKRTMLENKLRKDNTDENLTAFKRQRNHCVKLLKEAKKSYFGQLKPSLITDNKKFWKSFKPLFSKKNISTDDIVLTEGNVLIYDPKSISEIFGTFFSNAIKNLNIEKIEFPSNENLSSQEIKDDDPIRNAIDRYSKHPSILEIKEFYPCDNKFTFQKVTLKEVTQEIQSY